MVISMSNVWSVFLSAFLWPAWGFFTGWWYRRKSLGDLRYENVLSRLRGFESNGDFYDERLHIRRWKDHLPETGGWFGISKRQLPGLCTDDLERFALECHRGELTHWAVLMATPFFAIWCSGWALVLVILVGLAASIPFIAILRYNRLRVLAILARRRSIEPSLVVESS
jgi:glycosyl-4,4'-diaponeurosporenoate acyltransferase